jgi:hypothetical protein
MILNEFFNLPQVFEKDMTEGVMSEIDLELRDIVAREDFDALYELFSANTPAGRYVQDMYDDVVIDTGLHPDDDFERIEQIVFDRLADDFGEPGMAEGAPISIVPDGDKGGAVDNFKQQMANRTEVQYQQNLKNIHQGVAEGSTTRGGFGGSAGQAQHEIEWLKKKISSLPPTKEKQIRDLQRQIRERELAIAFQKEGVEEGKPKEKEADYGADYQAMVQRVGQKAKQQELAKKKQQEQPKAPVRESRLVLLKQIIQS